MKKLVESKNKIKEYVKHVDYRKVAIGLIGLAVLSFGVDHYRQMDRAITELSLENDVLSEYSIKQDSKISAQEGTINELEDNVLNQSVEIKDLTKKLETVTEEKNTVTADYNSLKQEYENLKKKIESNTNSSVSSTRHQDARVEGKNLGNFVATAYDLSYNSCGKYPSHPYYGITASGVSLVGQTRSSAKAIAVDPDIIPMKSKVHLKFEPAYSHFDGIYTAVDTGGAIKGRKIDVFMGAGEVASEVRQFGIRQVEITLL